MQAWLEVRNPPGAGPVFLNRFGRRLTTRSVGRSLEAFLDEWTALPLFGGLELTDAQQSDRLRNNVDGLGSSLRLAGTGAQGSLWPRLRELNMDVLALAGADDEKFSAIARQIADAIPAGRFQLIPGAAHAAHLQQPEAVAAAIAAFIS